METWHNRLQKALDERGEDWSDLIGVTGAKKQSVYKWKPDVADRANNMDWINAIKACKHLKINIRWLALGELPSGLEEVDTDQSDANNNTNELSDDAKILLALYESFPPNVKIEALAKFQEIQWIIQSVDKSVTDSLNAALSNVHKLL